MCIYFLFFFSISFWVCRVLFGLAWPCHRGQVSYYYFNTEQGKKKKTCKIMKVECRYFGAVMITVGSWFSADDLQDKGEVLSSQSHNRSWFDGDWCIITKQTHSFGLILQHFICWISHFQPLIRNFFPISHNEYVLILRNRLEW